MFGPVPNGCICSNTPTLSKPFVSSKLAMPDRTFGSTHWSSLLCLATPFPGCCISIVSCSGGVDSAKVAGLDLLRRLLVLDMTALRTSHLLRLVSGTRSRSNQQHIMHREMRFAKPRDAFWQNRRLIMMSIFVKTAPFWMILGNINHFSPRWPPSHFDLLINRQD